MNLTPLKEYVKRLRRVKVVTRQRPTEPKIMHVIRRHVGMRCRSIADDLEKIIEKMETEK